MRFLALAAALGLVAISSAQVFVDDFNRPDGALGANWVVNSGPMPSILGNQAAGTASAGGLTLVNAGTFVGAYNQTVVKADMSLSDQNQTLAFAAIALGNDNTSTASHGIYIKLQRQSHAMFNFIGFYTGAGSNTTAITVAGGNFQALATPVAAARVSVWVTGLNVLNVGLDTDFNNIDDVSYTGTLNFPTMIVGNRVGMHIFGTTGRIDNFSATVVPEPATLAALGLGVAALIRRRIKK